MIDIGEALTRKLGPLPTWGWAGVLGVGLIGYRAVAGRSSASSGASSGSVQSIGGDGASYGYGDLGSDAGGGSADGSATATIGGGTLPGVVGAFSSAFALQQQLNDALTRLSGALSAQSAAKATLADLKIKYRDGKIDKATYAKWTKIWTDRLTAANTDVTTTQSLIANLKAQLAAIFAAPAAA